MEGNDGVERMKHEPMSPRKAIRLHCLECCSGSASEVKKCTREQCFHFEFRFGTKTPAQSTSPAKAIRGRCLDCGEGIADVRRCVHDACPTWPFRFGKSPYYNREGSGFAAGGKDE